MKANDNVRRQHLRILIVDDEPLVRHAMQMLLAFDGHRVEAADGAKAALSLLADLRFDLVLTDYVMPSMRGDELAAAIKAKDPRVPVVMVTGHAEELQASGSSRSGIDEIVRKPFGLEGLRKLIAKFFPAPLMGTA
jgi:CheY-like chemotaxis protein